MPYGSNAEFFEALRNLIDSWCDRRSYRPLSRILRPYLGFNGMMDGWGELSTGLKSIRTMDRDELAPSEQVAVDELIRAADLAMHKR
jgi:hypothetical protein